MRPKFRLVSIVVLFFVASTIWLVPSQAQKPGVGSPSGSPPKASPSPKGPQATPQSGLAVGFAVSPPLRDLTSSGPRSETDVEGAENELNELNRVPFRVPSPTAKPDADGALQKSTSARVGASVLTPPIVSFDGISNQDNFAAFGFRVSPPDTNMDVGPNHIVQIVNLMYRIYDKTGTPLIPPRKVSTIFSALAGPCATSDNGDPIALYDALADRWLISQFCTIANPNTHQLIAISQTSDPTGAYFLYDFMMPNNKFNDYPHFGVWPDGYYMTDNQFNLAGTVFLGAGAFAFDRKKMLAGDPSAGFIYFDQFPIDPNRGGQLPSDLDGLVPPPPGTPNYFAEFTATEFGSPADAMRVYEFHADFGAPASSTFTERADSPIPVAAFNPLTPPGRDDIEQPPPAVTATASLDSIQDRLMHRLQYRNFGSYESLVVTHTVNVGTGTTIATHQSAIRYYQFQRNLPAGTFTIPEQATFSPDTDNRWMGSAAMDNQGNLAVGYSVSSLTTFPSIRYAGRLATDPPNGLFQGEASVIAGTGVQTNNGSRWGDYSMLAVDPADDCTFWYTTEYYTAASQATSTVGWLTRIASFKVNQNCTSPPRGTLQGMVTNCVTGLPIQGALVQTTNGYARSTNASGSYSISPIAPGTYNMTASAPGYLSASASGISVSANGTTTQDFCLIPVPDLAFDSATVSGGNGNGVIDTNECNDLSVTLKNIGAAAASNVFATISTSTPGVTITQPNSPYPNIGPGATGTNIVPFSVSTSPAFACGTTINITMALTFTGGTDMVAFTLPSCVCPNTTVTGSLVAGDAQQNLRIFRDGAASTCAVPKAACPGTTGAGTRSFDQYSFTNTDSVTRCITATLTGVTCSGLNVFGTTYLGSFNPANICQNYLADPGASFNPTATWSFNVPAGATFIIVVAEVNAGQGCAGYSVTLSGLPCLTDGGGQCVPCSITCPANISQPNDPDQCGAVVNFAPTTTGTCGVVTCSPPSGSFFPVGTTNVTCNTTQGSSCTFTVTVNDTQRPVVTCDVATTTLSSANHDLVNVGLSATASDNCPGVVVSVAVFGDENDEEPTGDGVHSPDAKDIAPGTLRLRAERKGDGDGRVYLIIVTATDAAGNVSRCCRTVTVARDQSKGSVASVAAQAAAARAYCEQNGTAPPGYFVIGDGPVIGPKQ